MKNIFKLMCAAAVAGVMIFSACTPGDTYTITVKANNNSYGTVSGGGKYEADATATLTATPKEGYKFIEWDDHNTTNPRLVTVTADATYIANFGPKQGVSVTFGNTSWDAQYVNAQIASNAVMVAAAQVSSNQYPIINIQNYWETGNPEVGTYTGAPSLTADSAGMVSIGFGSPRVWYFENGTFDLQGESGTMHTGDWWGKNVTLNISALDADALTGSATVNATMAKMGDLLNAQGQLISIDLNTCTQQALTASIIDQTFTAYTGKKGIVKNVVVKL
ncbi:MAG: hypothetical protein K5650_06145 [Bacteroidales bacterium]|nr:hypothetical protein [Bacteroidales bacterium]